MSHPNEAIVRQMFALFRAGEREEAAEMFSEEAGYTYPGPGPLRGDWRTRTGVLRFWAEQDRCSGGEFEPQMLDLVAGDRNVFLLVRVAQGGVDAWERVVVYEVTDSIISEATVYEGDSEAAEAFFSRHAGAN